LALTGLNTDDDETYIFYRQALQYRRDEISKEGSDYFTEFNQFMGSTTKEINDSKTHHSSQSKKVLYLFSYERVTQLLDIRFLVQT